MNKQDIKWIVVGYVLVRCWLGFMALFGGA